MRAFPTGQASMPTIYSTESGLCFLEIWRAHWEKPRIRHMAGHEARRLAETYGMYALSEHLKMAREVAMRVGAK